MKKYAARSVLPIQKVGATAAAGFIVTIVLWVLHTYADVDVPADVAAALTMLIGLIIGYVTPIEHGELVEVAE